jgi:hypothetical protein
MRACDDGEMTETRSYPSATKSSIDRSVSSHSPTLVDAAGAVCVTSLDWTAAIENEYGAPAHLGHSDHLIDGYTEVPVQLVPFKYT